MTNFIFFTNEYWGSALSYGNGNLALRHWNWCNCSPVASKQCRAVSGSYFTSPGRFFWNQKVFMTWGGSWAHKVWRPRSVLELIRAVINKRPPFIEEVIEVIYRDVGISACVSPPQAAQESRGQHGHCCPCGWEWKRAPSRAGKQRMLHHLQADLGHSRKSTHTHCCGGFCGCFILLCWIIFFICLFLALIFLYPSAMGLG